MRTVIQRVKEARVTVDDEITGEIGSGLLILVGFEADESQEDFDWMVKKIVQLRIFNDENAVMNLSVTEVNGAILLVSQFTLHAATKKGNRPSYMNAAKPEIAIPYYEKLILQLEEALSKKIQTGRFGANMQVELCNDGPVTIILDSKNKDF